MSRIQQLFTTILVQTIKISQWNYYQVSWFVSFLFLLVTLKVFIAPHSEGAHYHFSAQIPSMASCLLGAQSESLLVHELPECLPPSLLSPSVSPTFLPSLCSSFLPAQRADMLPPLGFCSCHDLCLESMAPRQSPVSLPPSFPFIFFHRSF